MDGSDRFIVDEGASGGPPDLAFISAARTDLPDALAEIERAWREIERLTLQVDFFRDEDAAGRALLGKAEAREAHAHDAANALYRATRAVLASPGPDLQWSERRDAIDTLRAALDPQQAAAALKEAQRRDGLEAEVKRLRSMIETAGGEEGLSSTQLVRWFEEAGTEREKSATEVAELRAVEFQWRRERGELLERVRAAEGRPPLTEEAALAWADKIGCGVLTGAWIPRIATALLQAARGEWATAADVEAITHEFRPGAYGETDAMVCGHCGSWVTTPDVMYEDQEFVCETCGGVNVVQIDTDDGTAWFAQCEDVACAACAREEGASE